MGCDIHMYLEYKYRGLDDYRGWPRINPGRDYTLFGVLAGVRTEGCLIPPRGLPDDVAWNAGWDNTYVIVNSEQEKDSEQCVTLKTAEEWVQKGYSKFIDLPNGKRSCVTNPDWHSHSWLTLKEFMNAIKVTEKKRNKEKCGVEYYALIAAAKEFEKQGYETRFVFWFDN